MKTTEASSEEVIYETDHVHEMFGLTYAAYLVLPRSILQSMPAGWQKQFCELMAQYDQATDGLDGYDYSVQAKDGDGKFVSDPFRDYERGRRKVDLKPIAR